MTSGAPSLALPLRAPAIRRRMACMLYEGVLLFGVVVAAALLYGTLTEQRHALRGSTGLQTVLFAVLGLYFVGFWSSTTGQTLAMKTWHIRVQAADGRAPGRRRALARYLASWLWFAPALASLHWAGIQELGFMVLLMGVGFAAYALLALLRPDRQFLHDVLCGTWLVDTRQTSVAPAQSAS